jgi:hypothetical protein
MADTSGFRWASTMTRAGAGVMAVLVIVQAAFAGLVISGDRWALAYHRETALLVLGWLGLAIAVAALLAWRPGRRPGRPAVAALVGFLAIGLQMSMGFAGVLSVHVPLGVVIFGIYLWLALGDRPRAIPEEGPR